MTNAHSLHFERRAVKDPHFFVSVVKVGRYLFLITGLLAWAGLSSLARFNMALQGGELRLLDGLLSGFFFTNIILSVLDGRSRFQNYRRLKDQLFLYGITSKYLKTFGVSRCQREAVMVAAGELGMEREVKDFYMDLGYRWYHFVPDFFFSNPLYLLDWRFWKHTFFAPKYTPRIDYSEFN